jgi:thiol:disulfide interchange protein DsbD
VDDGNIATDLDFSEEVPWQPFTEDRVAALAGQPVFVDFTADWCLSCKANEKTVLASESVRSAMKAHGVVPLKADWTRRDAVITKWLQRYGKAGVPFYLMIPADPTREHISLPEIITPGIVIDAFERAK